MSEPYGPIPNLEKGAATRLLEAARIDSAKPLVAFDVISRKREAKRGTTGKPPEYKLLGDRRLFEGIDSAVKAAFHGGIMIFRMVSPSQS